MECSILFGEYRLQKKVVFLKSFDILVNVENLLIITMELIYFLLTSL